MCVNAGTHTSQCVEVGGQLQALDLCLRLSLLMFYVSFAGLADPQASVTLLSPIGVQGLQKLYTALIAFGAF